MDVSVGVKKKRHFEEQRATALDEGPGEAPKYMGGDSSARGEDDSYMMCLACSQRRMMVVQDDG
jgi:hypothetical protein